MTTVYQFNRRMTKIKPKKKAMESMGETKKQKLSTGTTDEDQPTNSRRKRCVQPLVDFLRENANAERELRQKELDKTKGTGKTAGNDTSHVTTAADESGFHISCQ